MRKAVLIAIGLMTIAFRPLSAQESLWVEEAIASQTTANPVIRVTGTLEPVWQASLAGTQGGRLREIICDAGDGLASGAIAWTLDDEDARLAMDAAKATEIVATRQLEELRSGARAEEIERLTAIGGEAQFFLAQIQAEKKRLSKLFDQELVPPVKWDEIGFREKMAERQVAAAEAGLKAARAGPTPHQISVLQAQVDRAKVLVAQARKRIQDCIVRTPRSGRVIARLRQPGEVIAPGEPVLRIVSLDPIKVRFHVGETQVSDLKVSLSLSVQVPAGSEARPATLTAIVPQCDPTTRRVPCEALLSNPDERLIPGQSAEIVLVLSAISGATIPRAAITDTDGHPVVFVIEDNRVHAVQIKIISHIDGSSMVEGISPGTHIVSHGAFGLKDGAAVKIKP